MRVLSKIFLKGLLAVLPLFVTIYIFVWFAHALESVFGAPLRWLLPDAWYLPGTGFALGLIFIFGVGLTLQIWFLRRVWRWGEGVLENIPLVKEVYGSLRQMVEYLSSGGEVGSDQTVTVSMGDGSVRLLGLITRSDLGDAAEGIAREDEETVAVFLPMSYQMGGFTVYVPKSQTEPVKMDTKEALQWTFTAGVGAEKGESEGKTDES